MPFVDQTMLLVVFNQEQPDLEGARVAIEAALKDACCLVPVLDFTVQTCGEGDPLVDLSAFGSGTDISAKQENLLNWKLGVLNSLNAKAFRIPGVDEAAAQIAVDVYFVANTELQEHKSKKTIMTKKRAHDLIDAVIEAVNDMEFEIENAN